MNDEWFVIEKGRGRYRLRPVSGGGWLAFLLFMAVMLAPIMAFTFFAAKNELTPLWMLAWLPWFGLVLWLFMGWARQRAKVIDLDEVARDYAEFQAWKRRGKR